VYLYYLIDMFLIFFWAHSFCLCLTMIV